VRDSAQPFDFRGDLVDHAVPATAQCAHQGRIAVLGQFDLHVERGHRQQLALLVVQLPLAADDGQAVKAAMEAVYCQAQDGGRMATAVAIVAHDPGVRQACGQTSAQAALELEVDGFCPEVVVGRVESDVVELQHQAVDVQKESVHQFVDAMESMESMAEQNNDVSKQTWHAMFDAMASMLPEGSMDVSEFEEMVDDGFDQLTESQQQAFDAMNDAMADGASAYDEFADAYVDAVDSTFDSFLDTHEDVEAEVEDATESLSA